MMEREGPDAADAARFWSQQTMEAVMRKATTGTAPMMGLSLDEPLSNDLLDRMVVAGRPLEEDIVREAAIDRTVTALDIGKGRSRKPLSLSMPLFIGPPHYSFMSVEARTAMLLGAVQMSSAAALGEHIPSLEVLEQAERLPGKLILNLTRSRRAMTLEYLSWANAVEIDLTNTTPGAVPGTHLDIESAKDIAKMVVLVREATEYKLPVMARVGAANVHSDVKTLVDADCDAVVIEGGQGPRMARPQALGYQHNLPLAAALPQAVKAFREKKAWEDKGMKLVASGWVRNGLDVFKLLAMGADAVCTATAPMVAMGCTMCGDCYMNRCPQGIAALDEELTVRIDIEDCAMKVSNFLSATNNELRHIMALTGCEKLADIKEDHLRASDYSAASITGLKLMGYDKKLPMWEI